MRLRTYSELIQFDTFRDRFEYLKLNGIVGHPTFGFERYLNQRFYTSTQWKHVRNQVIARDLGMDLGVEGYEIHDRVIIHHMNPMVPEDLIDVEAHVLDPRYLITTTHRTHNAIHYGDSSQLLTEFAVRQAGDTRLW